MPITPLQIWNRRAGSWKTGSNLLLVAAGVAMLVEIAQAFALPNQPSGALTNAMVLAILLFPVIAFFLCAIQRHGRHLGWILIGIGLALNSIGEAYFFFGQRTLTVFPTPGDLLCLALFPLLFAGVIVLVREGRERTRLSIGIDGIVIALAIGSLTYELIFNGLINQATNSRLLVGGQLAYPILDLATLTLLAVILHPKPFPGRRRLPTG